MCKVLLKGETNYSSATHGLRYFSTLIARFSYFEGVNKARALQFDNLTYLCVERL